MAFGRVQIEVSTVANTIFKRSCRPALVACGLMLALLQALAPARAQGRDEPAMRPGDQAQPRFDILEFVVAGDTLLGSAAIERAVYAFMGPGRTVADAEGARKALEKAYQDAGYLSVSVVLPPQRVDGAGGEVRLQVVQGAVDTLRVTGAQFHLPSLIKQAVPSLAPGNVPNFNELQQELATLARTTADTDVTPVLAAGDSPGTLTAELKVQDTLPLHGSLEVNNKQALNTEPGRVEAGLSYGNLFQRGHSAGLFWLVSPRRPAQADIQTASYDLPLGGVGDRLSLLFVHSNSDTPTALGGGTVSRGRTGRLRWRDELPAPGGDFGHGLTWGLTLHDLRDTSRDVAGMATASPPLRYTTFNLAYDLTLNSPGSSGNAGSARNSRVQAELTISPSALNRRNVDCFGTVREQFDCKRRTAAPSLTSGSYAAPASASPGFQVFSLTLAHTEPLGRWLASARLQSQITDVPLVPAEQVVSGGQDSVRGYYEGEQAGDLGVALRLELATPVWLLQDRITLGGLVFHDRAALRRLYATGAEQADTQLASAGFGLRVGSTFGLQATLAWARLLRDTTTLDASGRRVPASGAAAGRAQRWDLLLRQTF